MKIFTLIKIHHYNENSSLQWKFIDEMNLMIVMKIHKCDENLSL